MLLNTHERWLLRVVGLTGNDRRDLLAAVHDGGAGDEVDIAAQEGGYDLAKRSRRADLEPMLNRLMNPAEPRVRKVVYGHRRYKRAVILAAALRQAGVTLAAYRRGSAAGFCRLEDFVGGANR
jgi:hypothetical protein